MSTVYVVVTILAGAWVGYSAAAVFFRAKWVVQALTDYSVRRLWWPWLGMAKTAGVAGLLVGLFVPVSGVMAEIGLVLYFAGAVITVAGRAGTHTYRIHWSTWHRWSLPRP